MMANYEQLPELAWTGIADFFGVEVSAADLETLKQAAKRDAKNPMVGFERDPQAKPKKASEALRAASERWLSPLHERFEAARFDGAAS